MQQHAHTAVHERKAVVIDGLQPIPRDSVDKGMAAMLVEQTGRY